MEDGRETERDEGARTTTASIHFRLTPVHFMLEDPDRRSGESSADGLLA